MDSTGMTEYSSIFSWRESPKAPCCHHPAPSEVRADWLPNGQAHFATELCPPRENGQTEKTFIVAHAILALQCLMYPTSARHETQEVLYSREKKERERERESYTSNAAGLGRDLFSEKIVSENWKFYLSIPAENNFGNAKSIWMTLRRESSPRKVFYWWEFRSMARTQRGGWIRSHKSWVNFQKSCA